MINFWPEQGHPTLAAIPLLEKIAAGRARHPGFLFPGCGSLGWHRQSR